MTLGVIGAGNMGGAIIRGLLISPMFEAVYGRLGTTFGGNHLACTAALAVLDVMEQENLIDNAARTGQYLIDACRAIPQIKEVRGQGLMIGLDFGQPIKALREKLLYQEHIFTGVSGTDVIRLLPPLCLSRADAETFVNTLKKLLQ